MTVFPFNVHVKSHRTLATAATLAVTLALSGCDRSLDQVAADLSVGKQLLAQGEADRASEQFLKVIQADGANVEAIFLRGRALEAQKLWSEAYAHYLRAIDLHPETQQYALAALDLEVRAARWPEAEKRLSGMNLAASDKTQWEARIAAGKHDWSMADRLYRQITDRTDVDLAVLLDAADTALRLGGAEDRAVLLVERALARDPASRGARLLRAQINLQSGNDRVAAEDLQGLFEESPSDITAALKLGALRVRLNQLDAAESVYRRFLETTPGDLQITLAYGELLSRTGKLEELDHLAAQIDVSNQRAEGLRDYLTGLVHLGQAKPDEALEPLRKATLLLGENPGVWFAYAQAAFGKGDRATAKLAYDKVLELAPQTLAAELQNARIELLELDARAAKVRSKRLLKSYPDNLSVQALGVRIALLEGRFDDALQLANAALEKQQSAQLTSLKATALSRLGRDEEALALYQALIEANASDVATRAEAARILDRLGRTDEARALLESVAENDANAFASRGVLELRAGKQDEAKRLLEQALTLDPDQFQANLNLAMMRVTEGDLDGAKTLLDRAVATSPKDPLVHQTLGLIAQARVELDLAEQHYRQALSSDASLILSHVGLAEVQLAAGRPLEAVSAARKALELNPKSERALLALGSGRAALGELGNARQAFDDALAITPDNIEALVQRGRLGIRQQNPESALADFDHALSLEPKQGAALLGKLDALFQLKRSDDAFAELDRRLTDTPDNTFLQRLKGTLLIRSGRGAEAVGLLQAVFDKEPSNPASALLLARAMLAANDQSGAMQMLKTAEPQSTTPLPLRMYRAQIADDTGDLPTAIEIYRSVLAQAPDYVSALNNLAWALHRHQDPAGEAIKLARRAYSLDATSVSVADTLGVILTDEGQAGHAVPVLENASRQAPGNTLVQLHLAEALAANNERDKAFEMIQPLLAEGVPERDRAAALVEKLGRVADR
ncbi:MAG: tetratricopeptide repeat protein [Gammaproteobacteria bacterium]|nr:tetratricopeptide repeat protein [Gammaproteobacteria bacterium]MCP5136670.1 tetratricopeptide repeat protein [Gammaproteobacteria bacterium]